MSSNELKESPIRKYSAELQAKYENLDDWLTIDQVASYLRVSRNIVYDAVKSGQLPSRRFTGRLIRIPRSVFADVHSRGGEALALLRQQEQQGSASGVRS